MVEKKIRSAKQLSEFFDLIQLGNEDINAGLGNDFRLLPLSFPYTLSSFLPPSMQTKIQQSIIAQIFCSVLQISQSLSKQLQTASDPAIFAVPKSSSPSLFVQAITVAAPPDPPYTDRPS